jgi:hypothetical protein
MGRLEKQKRLLMEKANKRLLVEYEIETPRGRQEKYYEEERKKKEKEKNLSYDLNNPEVVSNFEDEIVGLLNKYLGISFTDNAGTSNDNRVFIYNNLMDMVNQRFAPSSLRKGSHGNEYYTNRPEDMTTFLNSIGEKDFELKSVRK